MLLIKCFFVRGNKLADHYAGLASRSHGFSEELTKKAMATTKLYTILIYGMGKVLAEWPTFGELGELGRVEGWSAEERSEAL